MIFDYHIWLSGLYSSGEPEDGEGSEKGMYGRFRKVSEELQRTTQDYFKCLYFQEIWESWQFEWDGTWETRETSLERLQYSEGLRGSEENYERE